MRRLTETLFMLVCLVGIASCSRSPQTPVLKPGEAAWHQDHLLHKNGADTPYTGIVRKLYPDGSPELEQEFENGRVTENGIDATRPNV